MTQNGQRRHWRLVLRLPDRYAEDTAPLFAWLRTYVIPACLHAPVPVTLVLEVPEDDGPEEE